MVVLTQLKKQSRTPMYVSVDKNVIKLYGYIWNGDANYVISQIQSTLDGYTSVDIHVHGPGGSVIDGNMIMNAIKISKAKVTMIIDGLAASMYSQIILSGDTIKMASNGFIMVHAPQGGAYGTKEDLRSTAKVLESMEKTFLKAYSKRTGREEKKLEDWLKNDNWFDAEEALKEGLIDEIIDPFLDDLDEESVKASIKPSTHGAAASIQVDAMFQLPTSETQTPNIDMKITATNLVFLGLKDGATEAEVNAAIEVQAAKIKELQASNKTIEDAQEAANTKRNNDLVEAAFKAGKITAEQKPQYIQLAGTNYDLAKSTLDSIPAKKDLNGSAIPSNNQSAAVVAGRETWTFDDWRKKDTVGLLKMKQENLEAYNALLAASN